MSDQPPEQFPSVPPRVPPRRDVARPKPVLPVGEAKPANTTKIVLIVLGCVALLFLMLFFFVVFMLPGVVAGAGNAAYKSQTSNQMRKIQIAVIAHQMSNDDFLPAAITDDQGAPLLSWRVALLPFLGHDSLYREFHLDEPWDSPHNRPLADRMPSVYASPSSESSTSRTHFLLPVGPGTLFDPAAEGELEDAEIPDGASQTILLVEAGQGEGVVWTKPEDFHYNPDAPSDGLVNDRFRGFHLGFADGAVRFVPQDCDLENLKAAFTCDGQDRYNPAQ